MFIFGIDNVKDLRAILQYMQRGRDIVGSRKPDLKVIVMSILIILIPMYVGLFMYENKDHLVFLCCAINLLIYIWCLGVIVVFMCRYKNKNVKKLVFVLNSILFLGSVSVKSLFLYYNAYLFVQKGGLLQELGVESKILLGLLGWDCIIMLILTLAIICSKLEHLIQSIKVISIVYVRLTFCGLCLWTYLSPFINGILSYICVCMVLCIIAYIIYIVKIIKATAKNKKRKFWLNINWVEEYYSFIFNSFILLLAPTTNIYICCTIEERNLLVSLVPTFLFMFMFLFIWSCIQVKIKLKRRIVVSVIINLILIKISLLVHYWFMSRLVSSKEIFYQDFLAIFLICVELILLLIIMWGQYQKDNNISKSLISFTWWCVQYPIIIIYGAVIGFILKFTDITVNPNLVKYFSIPVYIILVFFIFSVISLFISKINKKNLRIGYIFRAGIFVFIMLTYVYIIHTFCLLYTQHYILIQLTFLMWFVIFSCVSGATKKYEVIVAYLVYFFSISVITVLEIYAVYYYIYSFCSKIVSGTLPYTVLISTVQLSNIIVWGIIFLCFGAVAAFMEVNSKIKTFYYLQMLCVLYTAAILLWFLTMGLYEIYFTQWYTSSECVGWPNIICSLICVNLLLTILYIIYINWKTIKNKENKVSTDWSKSLSNLVVVFLFFVVLTFIIPTCVYIWYTFSIAYLQVYCLIGTIFLLWTVSSISGCICSQTYDRKCVRLVCLICFFLFLGLASIKLYLIYIVWITTTLGYGENLNQLNSHNSSLITMLTGSSLLAVDILVLFICGVYNKKLIEEYINEFKIMCVIYSIANCTFLFILGLIYYYYILDEIKIIDIFVVWLYINLLVLTTYIIYRESKKNSGNQNRFDELQHRIDFSYYSVLSLFIAPINIYIILTLSERHIFISLYIITVFIVWYIIVSKYTTRWSIIIVDWNLFILKCVLLLYAIVVKLHVITIDIANFNSSWCIQCLSSKTYAICFLLCIDILFLVVTVVNECREEEPSNLTRDLLIWLILYPLINWRVFIYFEVLDYNKIIETVNNLLCFSNEVEESLMVGHSSILIISLLLVAAFFAYLDRKIMASMQKRKGPNAVGSFGLTQVPSDAQKLLTKEFIEVKHRKPLLFVVAPFLSFIVSLSVWIALPSLGCFFFSDSSNSLFIYFAFSTLGIYGIFIAGWCSNSKYALLGAIRSVSQMISYELSLSLCIIFIAYSANLLSVSQILHFQSKSSYLFVSLYVICIFFIISTLVETNRLPFDLSESESELVAGYNVEYSGFLFSLFFIAEYIHMFSSCFLISVILFGGWVSNIIVYKVIIISIKLILFMFLFAWVRSTYPRYRFDSLIKMHWKNILVFLTVCLLLYVLIVNSGFMLLVTKIYGYKEILEFIK